MVDQTDPNAKNKGIDLESTYIPSTLYDTDPGKRFGGADPGAQINTALKNVASLLSRVRGYSDIENVNASENRYTMLGYIPSSSPEPTYKIPSTSKRAMESAAKYVGMAAEEGLGKAAKGLGKAATGFMPYKGESPSGRGAMNVYDTKPTSYVGAKYKLPGTYPVYPQLGARGSIAESSMISNILREAAKPPVGYYAPALPTNSPVKAVESKPEVQELRITLPKEFIEQSNFDTSYPEVNAYKGTGPKEFGGIDYISYATDLLTTLGIPYPAFAYGVASSESARGRRLGIKGNIPLNPDGSYKENAQGPWQFMPETAKLSGIELLREYEEGKWIDERGDPIRSSQAFATLTAKNWENFVSTFKRAPTASELYLAHLLGSGDLRKSIRAEEKDPNGLAIKTLPYNLVRNNLRVPDKEKDELAKTITIKGFLDMHQRAFDAYDKEYSAWRSEKENYRQRKFLKPELILTRNPYQVNERFQKPQPEITVNEYQVGGLVGPGGARVDPTTPAAQKKSTSQPTRAGLLKTQNPIPVPDPEADIRNAIQNAAESVGRFIAQGRGGDALPTALNQVAQWPVTVVTDPILAANQAATVFNENLNPPYIMAKGLTEAKVSGEQRDIPGVIAGLTQTAGGALGLIPGAGLISKRPPAYTAAAGQRAMTSATAAALPETPTPFAGVQGELFPNERLGPATYSQGLDTNFTAIPEPKPKPTPEQETLNFASPLDRLQLYGFENRPLNSNESKFVSYISEVLNGSVIYSPEANTLSNAYYSLQLTKPFKSKLEEIILKRNPETTKPMTAANWSKVLTDVRKQEIEESGLADFLKSKGDEKVSLEEIKNYLLEQNNIVNVLEIPAPSRDALGVDVYDTIQNSIEHELRLLKESKSFLHDEREMQPIYEQELGHRTISEDVFNIAKDALDERRASLRAYENALGTFDLRSGYEDLTLRNGMNYRNIILSWHSPSRGVVPVEGEHFKIPNVFAHMRVKDRVLLNKDPNGKPYLDVFSIEEIQSDLHQRGLRYGYKIYDPSKPRRAQVPSEFDVDAYKQRPAFDAPFKDNAWLKAATKRLLIEAYDSGYDYVAWIPGNTRNGALIDWSEIPANTKPDLFYDKVFKEMIEGVINGKRKDKVLAEFLTPDQFPDYARPEAVDTLPPYGLTPVSMHAINLKDPRVIAALEKLKREGMYQYSIPAAVGTGAAATTIAGQDKEFRVGGLVGPGGMRMRPYNEQPPAGEPMRFGYTPPVDRPILPAERPMPQYQEPPMPQRPGAPGLTPPRFDFMERRFPSYQEGGMIGPGGMPMRPAGVAQPQAPTMSSDQLESEIQRMMQQNPQAVQQIQQEIMSAMQSGELTPQELNMMVQLATLAAQNPQMYPRIRQFAIQQGIAEEGELGTEYDQGLVFTILLAARASQQQAQGGASPAMGQAPQVPQAAMQPPVASMMSGGALPQKSPNADGSVPIIAHEGEYVIPKDIVLRKGTEFFDKLIGKGSDASGAAK